MAGILDYVSPDSSSYAGLLTLPDGAFPPAPTKEDDVKKAKALWDAIDADNQAANAAADRRNAAGFAAANNIAGAPPSPIAAPDATSPAVGYSLGQMSPNLPGGTYAAGPTFGALAPLPVQSVPAAPQPQVAAVPLPRPRPANVPAKTDDDATLPANATPTQGQGTPGAPPVPETSLLGRMGQFLQDADAKIAPHTATLLALAGGLAGAPSWGTGIGRGLTQAAAALPVDQKMAMQQGGIQQTYRALVSAGVSPQLALASVYNPEILKSTVDSYLSDRKGEVKTIKDASGNERLVLVNPYNATQPVKDLTPAGTGASGILAPGVTQEDKTLTGDAYMAQYSPELQAMAKAYINGDIMPTGNPRMQGLQPKAKEIAIKWGMDTGTPVSDATYAEKRHMRSDLGASGNSSMGGILSNGQSSFSHLAELGESMADLGNTSHDFPGGSGVAAVQNYLGNTAPFASSATAAKITKIKDNLGHYGQESTKFYSGTGGGEAERMNALKEMDPQDTSSEEMAAYLEKEKSLMLDRMNTKFAQIKQTLGENEGNIEIQKKLPDLQKNISRIDASIARLRGGGAPDATAPQAAAPVRVNSPADAAKLPRGTHFLDPNGVERVVP